jgi:hypothetical protein
MYGTVARMTFDPANRDALVAQLEGMPTGVDGFISGEVLMGDEAGAAMLVVKFRDKASYMANADSPEQGERYAALRGLLSEDPMWFDGEWVAD